MTTLYGKPTTSGNIIVDGPTTNGYGLVIETTQPTETMMPKYVRALEDGRYEWGVVEQRAGKRDRMIAQGVAEDHDEACRLAGI